MGKIGGEILGYAGSLAPLCGSASPTVFTGNVTRRLLRDLDPYASIENTSHDLCGLGPLYDHNSGDDQFHR